MFHPNGCLNVLLIVSAILLAGGCAPKTQGEKMIQTYTESRELTAKVRGRVVKTMASLQALRRAPGNSLSDAFHQYKDAVNSVEAEDEDTRYQASGVKNQADEHIKAWEKEMATLNDPQMKSTLEDRQRAVRSNFKLVQMYAEDARNRFGQFLTGNKELVKALSIDLSPAAVAALAPSMDRVDADGRNLDERLAALQRALDNIAQGVSPLGPM